MDPPERNKRGKWSETQLKAAMQAVNRHEMSQRKAATVYSIPRRTLRNHLKSGNKRKITGRVPVLSKQEEHDLAQRIIRLAHIGLPLTPKLVRKQAYEFCRANNIKNPFSDTRNIAGKKWLKGFVKRNPEVSIRKAQFMNPGRAQKLNKPIVQQHFKAVKKIYDELDICNHPERLYNMDEKGCRLTIHHQQKVLAAKGAKRVHFVAQEHAENVTIAMCVNATGNCVPPMILFKGKRLKHEFCDHLPAGSLVKMAPKGSMTTELFVEFMHHLSQYKSSGKCLLIFDGASSHLDARIVDAADKYNIVLYCLPSNTTHELQPLDKSVNKSYEHHWDEHVLLYAYQHPDRKITKSRFGKIFTRVWSKCMTQENIINGFRATGLYPYDPSAIPDVAYAPSILTRLPDPQLQNISGVHDSNLNLSAQGQAIISVSPTFLNDTDSDITDVEQSLQNLSPSLLAQNDMYSVSDQLTFPLASSQHKLVDYSSSSDSEILDTSQQRQHGHTQVLTELQYDRNSEFGSPIPTTSLREQCRPLLNSSPLDGSTEDFTMIFQRHYQDRHKTLNIYTSSSSEAENLIHESDDSEDNLPLRNIKETAGSLATKTSFHEQIPTPNFAIVKIKPRRKALNCIGQKITRDLFDIVKDKGHKKEKLQKKSLQQQKSINKRPKRVENKLRKIDRNLKKIRNVTSCDKEQLKKSPQAKGRKLKKGDSKSKTAKEVWFCQGCKIERIADMRQCKECSLWYHEECVGLTQEDIEAFVCPDCN